MLSQKLLNAAKEGKLFSLLKNAVKARIKYAFYLLGKRVDGSLGLALRRVYMNRLSINDKKIVICECHGNFDDNMKYVALELIRQHVDCEIVWLGSKDSVSHREMFPREVLRVVEWYTWQSFKELATAKIILMNSVELFDKPFPKKPGQYVIETWHGSIGLKRFDPEVNIGKEWCRSGYLCGDACDFIVSNSNFEDEVYRKSFWKETPILKYGHPKNDIVVSCDAGLKKELRAKFFEFAGRNDNGEKLFLYGPTFRDNHGFECYDLDASLMAGALKRKFGGEWLGVYRYHPAIRGLASEHQMSTSVVDATDYCDMQELIVIADVAVTDYSSFICDFVLTKKPGFIFATDLKSFESERGFFYPLTSTPFPVATSNEEMVRNIENFDLDAYVKACDAFISDKGCVEDGNASKRVVEKIVELMN